MDNSMEQRFVDRLLHALAAMGDYDQGHTIAPIAPAPAPQQAANANPIPH